MDKIMRNELVMKNLSEYYCDNLGGNGIRFHYKEFEKVKMIFRALHKLDYKWREGQSLNNISLLKAYFNESISRNGFFTISIDDDRYSNCNIGCWCDFNKATSCYNLKDEEVPVEKVLTVLSNAHKQLKGRV